MSEILLEASRGPITENYTRGTIVVIDSSKNVVASLGDPALITYMRSAAKPLQAAAAVENGIMEIFGIDDAELAVMCGSHIGADYHVQAVQSILQKIDLYESSLALGPVLSMDKTLRDQRLSQNIMPRRIYNNCSGKHACMLSLCRAMGYDCNDYYLPDHPVQQLIKNTVAAYAQIIPSGIVIGIDGCGVPVFGLPLLHMAISYLNLCNQGSMESERLTLASRRIVNAIINYPEMIAGTGQFCTELSKATRGRIVGKLGSDGVYCCAVTDGGMALALKVEDGNGEASPPIIIEALKQLGLLSYEEQQLLTKFAIIDNINCQEEKIGETRPVFKLI